MDTTPLTSKVLAHVLEAHGWQQADLAKATGIAAPTVSAQLNGTRVIRDDHLAAYCDAVSRTEQPILVAAWLRDTLSPDAQANVLTSESNRLNEEARTWQPGLDDEQRQMIAWWSRQLAIDPELDEIFRAITRKAGFSAPATSAAASPPVSAKSLLAQATDSQIAERAASLARPESVQPRRADPQPARTAED